jgi:hypothetical protein
MVLGELYLSLSLREDEGNISGHQKKGEVLGTAGARKKHNSPQYVSFMGIRRGIGELLEMLLRL